MGKRDTLKTAYSSTFLDFDISFSYMASLIFLTCIFKAITHNRYFSLAVCVSS